MSHVYSKTIAGLIMLLTTIASSQSFAAIEDIQKLLDSGKNEAAYRQALLLAPELEGDTNFDFILGMAAMESGHLPEAVFALERALINRPDHHRARLELGRVYFLQGDYRNARQEFNTVLQHYPPKNVAIRINRFLDEIEVRLRAERYSTTSAASLAVGYDSNINSSTSDEQIDGPGFGTVTLSELSREIDDQFAELNAAAGIEYSLNRRSSVAGSLSLNTRNNFSYDEFDTATGNLKVEYRLKRWNNEWKFPLSLQQLNVDGSSFRRKTDLGTSVNIPERNRLFSADLKIGAIRYPDHQTRDVDFIYSGTGWRFRNEDGRNLFATGLNLGFEEPRRDSLKHFGRRYAGLHLSWQHAYGKSIFHAAFYYQAVEHTAEDSIFLKIRNDNFYQLALGNTWQLNRRWSATATLQGSVNDSNITFYDYDRVLLKGGLSYVY